MGEATSGIGRSPAPPAAAPMGTGEARAPDMAAGEEAV